MTKKQKVHKLVIVVKFDQPISRSEAKKITEKELKDLFPQRQIYQNEWFDIQGIKYTDIDCSVYKPQKRRFVW